MHTNKKPTAKDRTVSLFTGKTNLEKPNAVDGSTPLEKRPEKPWRSHFERANWTRDGLGRWYVEIPRREGRPKLEGDGPDECIGEVSNLHGMWSGKWLDPEKGWSLPTENVGFLPHATYAIARELWGRWKVLVGDYDPRLDPKVRNDS